MELKPCWRHQEEVCGYCDVMMGLQRPHDWDRKQRAWLAIETIERQPINTFTNRNTGTPDMKHWNMRGGHLLPHQKLHFSDQAKPDQIPIDFQSNLRHADFTLPLYTSNFSPSLVGDCSAKFSDWHSFAYTSEGESCMAMKEISEPSTFQLSSTRRQSS